MLGEKVNEHFTISLYPKGAKKATLTTVQKLKESIGVKNAFTALTRALETKADKLTLKFRKYGTVYFYSK